MSRNDNAKQRLSLSRTVILAMMMTTAALRLIEGNDFPWEYADITTERVRKGRSLLDLQKAFECKPGGGGFYEYKDARNDEICRTIYINGYYFRHGEFVRFESKCEIHNYRAKWEPRFVDVEIGNTNRHFYYTNERRDDGCNSDIFSDIFKEAWCFW